MRWKAAQTHARNKKKIKLALLVLGLIIAVLILAHLVRFTQVLLSPWKNESVTRLYFWDGTYTINLVLKTSSLGVLSFDPTQNKLTIIKIPDNTFLQVPKNFGSWQLSSIYGLGGNELLKDSLASFLGIPIDGFIELNGPLEKNEREFIDKNPLTLLNILPKIKTDLTVWELIRLKLSISQVRFDKIKDLDLKAAGVLDEVSLADGTKVFSADPVKLDSVLTNLSDPKLVQEHLSIAIFNATSYPLLAQKASRLVTNLGGNVIGTYNAESQQSKTYVLGERSDTLKRLIQIFGSDCYLDPKCDKIDLKSLGLESSRAQINLIVGEDFYHRF